MPLSACPARKDMEGQERTRLLPRGLNPAAARVDGMVSWRVRGQAARHGAGYFRELGMPRSAIAKVLQDVWPCWKPLAAGPARPEVV
jgi:hypothetical protein